MNVDDLRIAKRLLMENKLTLCVVKEQDNLFESKSHGVAAFLEIVEEMKDKLEGASVADKVAGKAVALMCVYVKVKAVYATTLSIAAEALFERHSIYFEYDNLVEGILRADRNSICPFEQLVRDVSDSSEAYRKLKSACHSKERLLR